MESLVEKYEHWKCSLSKWEIFINDADPSVHDKIQFLLRYEAAWTLLWALGYVEELSPPMEICDVPVAVTFMQKRTKAEFINDAKLR